MQTLLDKPSLLPASGSTRQAAGSKLGGPLVFLNLDEVRRRCGGKSRAWVYGQLGNGFPQQVKYGGGRSVAWLEHEIESWLSAQVEASRGQQ